MSDTTDDIESFYDEHGETLGLTGDYEHLEPVLPDVSGKRVLDAGCGLGDGQFDIVVCALTLGHVEEWDCVFEEFGRVLDEDGAVVVHAHHPVVDYLELAIEQHERITGESDRYTSVERFGRQWGPEGATMPFYRRPLGEALRPGLAAGFVLERFLEPGTGPHESDRCDPARPPRHLLMRFRKSVK